nr:MAG TPA: hypothetical protein [Caudoviricetes sp.]
MTDGGGRNASAFLTIADFSEGGKESDFDYREGNAFSE